MIERHAAWRNRPWTVGLDFDGTVYAGPWTHADDIPGPPTSGAIEWIREELVRGHIIVIHTCRLTPAYDWAHWPEDGYREQAAVVAALQAWFRLHGLTAAEVDALRFWTHLGKPSCDEYLDDKAVRFEGTFPRRQG